MRLPNIVLVIANPFLTGLSQLTFVRALAVNVTVWERTGPIIHFNRSCYYVYLSISSSCEDWLNLVCCKKKNKEKTTYLAEILPIRLAPLHPSTLSSVCWRCRLTSWKNILKMRRQMSPGHAIAHWALESRDNSRKQGIDSWVCVKTKNIGGWQHVFTQCRRWFFRRCTDISDSPINFICQTHSGCLDYCPMQEDELWQTPPRRPTTMRHTGWIPELEMRKQYMQKLPTRRSPAPVPLSTLVSITVELPSADGSALVLSKFT